MKAFLLGCLNLLSRLAFRLHQSRARGLLYAGVVFLYTIAATCFFIVGAMLVRGDVWAYIIYAENPYAHALAGWGCLLLARFFSSGYRCGVSFLKQMLAKSLLLLIGISISFLFGEVAIRWLLYKQQQAGSIERLHDHDQRAMREVAKSQHHSPLAHIINLSSNLKLVFELQPDLDMLFGHRVLRTNKHGMRADYDHEVDKPEGTFRIVGIGDSGMFGWGVDQGEEYMAVLQRNLNARGNGVRYEVLNLGVPGYNTQLEVEKLEYKGLAFGPDIVLVGWSENDFQLPFFLLEKENFTRLDISFLHVLLFARAQMADLVAGYRVRSLREFNEENVRDTIRLGAGVKGVSDALDRLRVLADRHGFQVLFFGPLKGEILKIIQASGLPYLNTFDAIDASLYPSDYEVHYMHPRPGGHAVIAQSLEREMDRRNWLPPCL